MLKLLAILLEIKLTIGKIKKKLNYINGLYVSDELRKFGKCYYAYFLLCKFRLMCSKNKLKFLKKVESAFQIFDHGKCWNVRRRSAGSGRGAGRVRRRATRDVQCARALPHSTALYVLNYKS